MRAYNKNGQLVEINDWTGRTSFALDLLGRITQVNDQNSKTTKYTYDAAGHKTQVQYPDNTKALYRYDALGRMTEVLEGSAKTEYSYDEASRLVKLAYPNGRQEEYVRDALGQLTELTEVAPDGTRVVKTTSYDPQGNILSENGRDYDYDELNRLISAVEGNTTRGYEYDSLGNLTLEKNGGQTTDYQYNHLNQLVSKTTGSATHTYFYDRRGNLTLENKNGATAVKYEYDETNRMDKGTDAATKESRYEYNGLGRLVSHTEDGKVTDYVIDYTSALPRNLVETVGGEVTKNLYGLNLLAKIVTGHSVPNPVTTYIQRDRLGSTVQATNASGAVVGSVTYDEWGNVTSGGVATVGGVTLDIKNYTGHDYDDVLGVYFAQARLYSSADKRFAAVDIIKGSISPIKTQYVYCRDNPLVFADFDGKVEVYIGDDLLRSAYISSDGQIMASLSELEERYGFSNKKGSGLTPFSNQITNGHTVHTYTGITKKEQVYLASIDFNLYGSDIVYKSWKINTTTGRQTDVNRNTGSYANPKLPEGDVYVGVEYFSKMMCDIGKGKSVTAKGMLLGKVIRIDPGHGDEPGATGTLDGKMYEERNLTLEISLHLRMELQARGATVIMSHEEIAKAVKYSERNINAGSPDMVISIHLNSSGDTSVKGVEILYKNNLTANKRLAESVLIDLKNNTSLGANKNPLRIRDDLFILNTSKAPASILVEAGYISNTDNLRYIVGNTMPIAKAIFNGIVNYYQ